MKKILFALIFSLVGFAAQAQHAYIECTGNVIFYTGSIERYGSPDLYVDARYNTLRSVWTATVQIGATGTSTNFVGHYEIEFDDATIDALTPTGSNNVEKIKNCLLQAVKAYLIVLNGGTTFTLH